MKLFKIGKKVRINKYKDLIYYMVAEMVKNRVEQGFIFHVIILTHYTF